MPQPLNQHFPVPTRDGEVNAYRAFDRVDSDPRFYYVNGMLTRGIQHALDAMELSRITERVVYGVYNATYSSALGNYVGGFGDFLQCVDDWMQIFLAKVAEYGALSIGRAVDAVTDWFRRRLGTAPESATADPNRGVEDVQRRVPMQSQRLALARGWLARNPAALSLFEQLRAHLNERQWIVAHSQGNLITSNALWGIVLVYGQDALQRMEVFSLASPSPAWPRGLRFRRKVYGYENDLVTLFDPHNWPGLDRLTGGTFGRSAGDWRRDGRFPSLDPHGLNHHYQTTLFKRRMRERLGLPPLPN